MTVYTRFGYADIDLSQFPKAKESKDDKYEDQKEDEKESENN